MTQVLVGMITYAGDKHCRELFFKYLAAIKTPVAYAFVTNSGEEDARELDKLAEPLRKLGRTIAVMTNEDLHENKLDQIVSNRNVLREYFLKGNWDYLYSLDTDCVGPTNSIDILLKHNKPLTTGWYLGTFVNAKKEPVIRPVAYVHYKEGLVKQLSIKDVLIPRFIPIAAAGLGCCLIHRDLLKTIAFRRKKAGEDAMFYKDVHEQFNEQLWLDTRVAYWHLKLPLTDKRVKLYDPRNYKLKKK